MWQIKKLGDIATFINGKAFKPTDWSDEGLPIIRIQNLTNSINDIHYYKGNVEDKYKITTGDILISWSATIDVFEWLKGDAVLNQHIFKVVFDKEPIDKNFFKYLIKQKIGEMLKNVHGSTMKHITKGDFDNIEVILPPLEEQKKIAQILDKADKIRTKKRLANDKLDEFLKSTFIDTFDNIVENKLAFPICKIQDIATKVTDGEHSTPHRVESGIKLLSARNIKNGYIDFNADVDYITNEEYIRISKRCKPEIGDILISCSGTVGRVTSVKIEEPFSLVRSVALIKLKKELVNSSFVEHLLRSKAVQNYILKQINKSSQANLFLGKIIDIPVMLPNLELQNKFAQIVEKVEAQKQKNEQVIEQMDNLFNSLSQRAFKGEL